MTAHRPTVGSATDVGHAREANEDALLVLDELWVVADGMGGHDGGEEAGRVAVETLARIFRDAGGAGERTAYGLEEAILHAHAEVLRRGRELGMPRMGSTVVAARADPAQRALTVCWVGDSRAYLMLEGRLRRLTTDHNEAADLVAAGVLTEDEAHDHPTQSILTECLGAGARTPPRVDTVRVPLHGRLLLCSDGLTAELRDEEIRPLLAAGDPGQACAALVHAALAAGGSDNVTVVVVDLG